MSKQDSSRSIDQDSKTQMFIFGVTYIGYQLTIVSVTNFVCLPGKHYTHCRTTLPFRVNLSLCSSSNPTLLLVLQYLSSCNANWRYKSLLLTFFFCFCTVNLELLTGTYSLFGEIWSHISSSLLLLSSHPAPAPLIRYTILALYKFICMYVCIMSSKQDCYRKFLLVQNQGLNPGIQSRNPGIGIFQSRNPGIGKEVRDCNPYARPPPPSAIPFPFSPILVLLYFPFHPFFPRLASSPKSR